MECKLEVLVHRAVTVVWQVPVILWLGIELTSQSIRRKSICFKMFCGKCRKPITEVDDSAGSGRVGHPESVTVMQGR